MSHPRGEDPGKGHDAMRSSQVLMRYANNCSVFAGGRRSNNTEPNIRFRSDTSILFLSE